MNRIATKLIGAAVAAILASGAMAGNKEVAVGLLTQGLAGDTAFIKEHVAKGYIQHNPQAPDKRTGLLGFVEYLQTLDTPVSIEPVRVLAEGDLVLVHSAMKFDGDKVVFDLFRFENGRIAEHWDGIADAPATTVSGRSMLDGPTEIVDQEKSQENKALVLGFVQDVLINGQGDKLPRYIGDVYYQHNPQIGDGLEGLGKFLGYLAENKISFGYSKVHRVVAEGNFVFVLSEGQIGGATQGFYDLFRVAQGKIVEHWDVIQPVPDSMVHENGMF